MNLKRLYFHPNHPLSYFPPLRYLFKHTSEKLGIRASYTSHMSKNHALHFLESIHLSILQAEEAMNQDFSHSLCIDVTGTKAALTDVFGQWRRRSVFELWDIICCYTLPDYFSPACCLRESKRICAVTRAYVSAL